MTSTNIIPPEEREDIILDGNQNCLQNVELCGNKAFAFRNAAWAWGQSYQYDLAHFLNFFERLSDYFDTLLRGLKPDFF